MTTQLSPAMRSALTVAAADPHGRSAATAVRTLDALTRRGLLDDSARITLAGRQAVGDVQPGDVVKRVKLGERSRYRADLPLHQAVTVATVYDDHDGRTVIDFTDEDGEACERYPLDWFELIERPSITAAKEAAERDLAGRQELAKIARRYGWKPSYRDLVTLKDGTTVTVSVNAKNRTYQCRKCDTSHATLDVVTNDRVYVMGAAPACELYPTVDTVRAYLLNRAAQLDAAIVEVPGYPANDRWAADAATLRAEAARLTRHVPA